MELLELRTNLNQTVTNRIPFHIYTIGTEKQAPMTRLQGFSAKQCIITFAGNGVFRRCGSEAWLDVGPASLLYIPAGLPHEYMPREMDEWKLGFVTFRESIDGWMDALGFGTEPYCVPLASVEELYMGLNELWGLVGEAERIWESSERFLSWCLEINKQILSVQGKETPVAPGHPDTIVDRITRFLHDHMERHLSLSELSAYVGYSPKQTVRLFRRQLGLTPHQYQQQIRLHSAALLLSDHPELTLRQVAAHVGMEPDYFSRLFKRRYGVLPSEYRTR